MADPKVKQTGMSQGDLVQALHEMIYAAIAQNANTGIAASDFTVDVIAKDGTVAGKNQA